MAAPRKMSEKTRVDAQFDGVDLHECYWVDGNVTEAQNDPAIPRLGEYYPGTGPTSQTPLRLCGRTVDPQNSAAGMSCSEVMLRWSSRRSEWPKSAEPQSGAISQVEYSIGSVSETTLIDINDAVIGQHGEGAERLNFTQLLKVHQVLSPDVYWQRLNQSGGWRECVSKTNGTAFLGAPAYSVLYHGLESTYDTATDKFTLTHTFEGRPPLPAPYSARSPWGVIWIVVNETTNVVTQKNFSELYFAANFQRAFY